MNDGLDNMGWLRGRGGSRGAVVVGVGGADDVVVVVGVGDRGGGRSGCEYVERSKVFHDLVETDRGVASGSSDDREKLKA